MNSGEQDKNKNYRSVLWLARCRLPFPGSKGSTWSLINSTRIPQSNHSNPSLFSPEPPALCEGGVMWWRRLGRMAPLNTQPSLPLMSEEVYAKKYSLANIFTPSSTPSVSNGSLRALWIPFPATDPPIRERIRLRSQ